MTYTGALSNVLQSKTAKTDKSNCSMSPGSTRPSPTALHIFGHSVYGVWDVSVRDNNDREPKTVNANCVSLLISIETYTVPFDCCRRM